STGNVIQGNYIGTNAADAANIGNGSTGVAISAPSTTIGGTAGGAGNTIAHNARAGVVVTRATPGGDALPGHSNPHNGGVGIDLGNDGVTANSVSGVGPNHLQPFPVLSSALADTSTSVTGTLTAQPSTTYFIDFYSSDVANASGHGEGKIYLGATTVLT